MNLLHSKIYILILKIKDYSIKLANKTQKEKVSKIQKLVSNYLLLEYLVQQKNSQDSLEDMHHLLVRFQVF